ncbi:hypothetical protein CALVIDRAFT_255585 [Calocera viscosa TUFC12733]|uniref:Uncharacterized protein n=1 Tax=Calocera viscosa (strain TUFC12733) TaxID=1330018 RepID=A0A167J8M3_CALVF|nr:hypothetical protein CALVIDRAFT_255585 [Calocera viscosa TUFC12733]
MQTRLLCSWRGKHGWNGSSTGRIELRATRPFPSCVSELMFSKAQAPYHTLGPVLLLTSTDDRLPDNSNTLNPIVLARLRNYNPTNIFRALWVLVAIVKSCIQLDQALGDTDNAAVFLEKEHWIEDPLKWAYEAGEFADVANILWLLRKPEVGIKIEPLEELQNPLFTELAKPVPSRIGTKIIQEMAIDAQAVPAVQVPAASASPARKRGAAPFKGRGPKKAVVIGNDVGKCSLCTRENRECIRPTNLKGPCETCKQLRKRCIQARQGVRKSGPMTSPQSGGR